MPIQPHIWTTLGPATLTAEFLTWARGRVDLLRLNMSHMTVAELSSAVAQIRTHTDTEICVDTEGAQIRTHTALPRLYRVGEPVVLEPQELTPVTVWSQLQPGDRLEIGFDGLSIQILDLDTHRLTARCESAGSFESNKGVHCATQRIRLPDLTDKDHRAIQTARELGIRTFALSFTRDSGAVQAFRDLLPDSRLIYKIETQTALDDLDAMFQAGTEFLIDRGDLGKDIGADHTPWAQRQVFRTSHCYPTARVYVATNFLESMITRPYATRAEINDIYTALEQGAAGLILAAETAIGQHPRACVEQVERIIRVYNDQLTTHE
jgi:pyruvate kinase